MDLYYARNKKVSLNFFEPGRITTMKLPLLPAPSVLRGRTLVLSYLYSAK